MYKEVQADINLLIFLGGVNIYRADYHTHTEWSFDSNEPMENMIDRAIFLNLNEIAFTDHIDYANTSGQFKNYIDYNLYIQNFNFLKEKYYNKIQLTLGVEVGFIPNASNYFKSFVNKNPFDYVIGSLHNYRGIEFDSPLFFLDKSKRRAYTEYFKEILEFVKNENSYDVIGHLDFIERYGRYKDASLNYYDYIDIIDEILKFVIKNDKGIEINTSGIRYKLGHLHPQFDIVKRYKELGGKIITIGSDAHCYQNIYSNFDLAIQYLLESGFETISIFRNHIPLMIKIV